MAKRLLAITVILLAALADWAQCPDFTDLTAPGVICQYGTFVNPFQYTGIAVNRHTVITQQGTDPSTNFQLPFLPPGESAVVRLGNNTGGEAEAITYQFTVDPDHSILLVKFAVVLEDPHHMSWDQPRFVMRVIDSVGNLVSSCSEYDVRASWEIPGFQSTGIVRWRPWTNFALDLTEYAGQQIRVQFVTYDCAYTAHFGYAYFTASCISNNLSISGCDGQSVTFSAPQGFSSYEWNNGDTISSSVYPQVPSTASCHITSVTGCEFTLMGTLLPSGSPTESAVFYDTICEDHPYHNHLFDLSPPYQPGMNVFNQVFYNSSDCSGDGVSYTLYLTVLQHYNDIYYTTCEGLDYHGYGFHYTNLPAGQILDTLMISLPPCDSVFLILHLTVNPSFMPTTTISGDLSVCDEVAHVYSVASMYGTTYQWILPAGVSSLNGNSSHEAVLYFTPQAPNPAVIEVAGSNGCGTGTASLMVEHYPSYHIIVKDTICSGGTYSENGFNVPVQDSMGIYTFTQNSSTLHGCDSVIVLQLMVSESPSLETLAQPTEICAGDSTTLQALGEGASFQIIPALEAEVHAGDILCTDYSIVKPADWPAPGKTAKGVVFYVDSTGQHGWAVALQDVPGGPFNNTIAWSYNNVMIGSVSYSTIRAAMSDLNGLAITQLLSQYNLQYPHLYLGNATTIFLTADELAAGWYVPTIRQLYIMFCEKGQVNASLQLVGSTLYNYVDGASSKYWSSTEMSANQTWCLDYAGTASTTGKMFDARVRFVCDF